MPYVDSKYSDIVGRSVVAASGVAVPGLFVPTLDLAGVGATWTAMIVGIAGRSGHRLSGATVAKLVASAASAVSAYMIGSKILTIAATPLILAFPFAGIPAAVALNSVLNGLFTLRLGAVCARHFGRPDFSERDALRLGFTIGTHLLGWPTSDEIRTVKEFLS
ncbi:hypothetical protein WEH80_40670 [Actinomycetes bacterium KLBMP 9759]